MNRNTLLGGLVLAVIIASAAFYGGMTYAKSQVPSRGQFANGQFTGTGAAGARGARGGTGGFTAGEILSKDATSITIKMQEGGTKIVLVSTSTQIMKSASGTLDDLSTGTNVVVTGSSNSDGSVTAQSVQIRPAGTSTFSRPEGAGQ